MKPAAQLKPLLSSRSWDKEVVLWLGSETTLKETLGKTKHVLLDLLDLFDPDSLPIDEEQTSDQLHDRLRAKLKSVQHGPGNRVVLVVQSIGLLARYEVGLKEFYDWFIGDFSMVILVLDLGTDKFEWPEEVVCEPNHLLGYFSEPGMVKEVFSTTA